MPRDVDQLATELQSPDETLRAAAAEKLSQLGEEAAPAALTLVKALEDPSEVVRQYANSALEDCGPPPAELLDDLEPLLAAPDPDVAYWTATLLGRMRGGAVQAVEALKFAAAEHPAETVRQRATWALGKIASG